MDARNASRDGAASAWTYRVPGRELQLWGAALTGAGRERVRPGEAYPLAGHPNGHDFAWERGRVLPFLQLVVCAAGAGRFESGPSRGIEIASGDVVLLVPGVRHRYRPDPARGWRVHWLELAGPVVARLEQAGTIQAARPLLRGAAQPVQAEVGALVAAALRPEADGASLAMGGLALLARVLSAVPVPVDGADAAVRQARESLAAAAGRAPDLRRLARDSGLTYAAFRRRFTASVGMPPRRWEILARLGRARELLAGGATVSAAAAACGFASQFYFSRRFKAAYGVPPSACMA